MNRFILTLPLVFLTACDKPAATTPPTTPTAPPKPAPTAPAASEPAPAPAPAPAEPEAPKVNTYTGVLLGDIAAIGGESTGWMLNQLDADGNILQATDVDVSKLPDVAKTFNGSKVRITGTVIEKDWVERGKTKVIVADKIEEVP